MTDVEQKIKQFAYESGFELTGIASAKIPPEADYFRKWLEAGYAADMHYLENRAEERLHPEKVMPGVRSVIACGLGYNTKKETSLNTKNALKAWISRYAWGTDYHEIVKKKLEQLAKRMKEEFSFPFRYKLYVDTGPILERVFAYRAGLGWFGKNSCLLHTKFGSYFLIGIILTDLELQPDSQPPDHCGTCTRCIDACPTSAIIADKVVDSNKCISYHTIENRKDIPQSIREKMGNLVFGCDICQEVCPWNRKAPLSHIDEFKSRSIFDQPDIRDLFTTITQKYPQAFRMSPLKRPKQKGLLRNLIIAIGNSKQKQFLDLLHKIDRNNQTIRRVSDWAVAKILKD